MAKTDLESVVAQLLAENAKLKNAVAKQGATAKPVAAPRVQCNLLGTVKESGAQNTGWTTVFVGGGVLSAKKATWRALVEAFAGDTPAPFAQDLLAKLEANEAKLV